MRQQHQGRVQRHCSTMEWGADEKPKLLPIAKRGVQSLRPWARWRNQLKAGGGGSGSNMMIAMMSMQMQQQAQQFAMHQQMFQQQIQMQMAAMEKRTVNSEKYVCQIVKTIGRKKRKRGGTESEYEDSSNSEK